MHITPVCRTLNKYINTGLVMVSIAMHATNWSLRTSVYGRLSIVTSVALKEQES